ncbi:MAG: LytTR family DNA-binding domain-containing protein [Bacteroidota bacterium]
MSKIRCLLIDDEPPAIELLQRYAGMIDQLEVVEVGHSAVAAFDMLKDKKVDLLFLDIRMPVLNGIDFVRTLQDPPAVILTTAYREYALEGYDLDIIDYLLKPIAFDRFLRAVDRYRERTSHPSQVKPASLTTGKEYIFLSANRAKHKVVLSEILYLESLKDYVRIHTKNGQLVVKGNLGWLMKQLPVDQFIRIHRSYAVALEHIQSYNQSEVTVGNGKLPLSLNYREAFMKRLLV